MVCPNPSVGSVAVGKASGRTLHLARHEGMGREASLVLVLRKQLGFVFTALRGFFTMCNYFVFIHTSVGFWFCFFFFWICCILIHSPLLTWDKETEKSMLVLSSSRHFSFHIRPLLIIKSSVLIMSSFNG